MTPSPSPDAYGSADSGSDHAVPVAPVTGILDDEQADALARLLAGYSDALPEAVRRFPVAVIPLVLKAVVSGQAAAVLGDGPVGQEADVADALALVRAARAELDGIEGALLLTARHHAADGRPLLTFRRVAAALAVDEDTARDLYRHRVGDVGGGDAEGR